MIIRLVEKPFHNSHMYMLGRWEYAQRVNTKTGGRHLRLVLASWYARHEHYLTGGSPE